MFFAAERIRQTTRKVKRPEGIVFSPEMEISVGAPETSRLPRRRSLETVYPHFASASVGDIIKLADPNYEEEKEEEEERPVKKHRVISASLPALKGDIDVAPSPEPLKAKKEYNNLDQLIRDFPNLERLIEAQQAKMEKWTVSREFTKPYEKPKPEQKPLSISQGEFFIKPPDSSGTQSMSTSSPPDLTSVPPTPSEPALGVGGGLLAGIDDIFGDRKRTTTKSKYRR